VCQNCNQEMATSGSIFDIVEQKEEPLFINVRYIDDFTEKTKEISPTKFSLHEASNNRLVSFAGDTGRDGKEASSAADSVNFADLTGEH